MMENSPILLPYRTVAAPVTASFTEKKSEFIAALSPVSSPDKALEFLEEVRRQNRKARHHVYAYLTREGNVTRCSDDGEPQGTGGVPVLGILQKNRLTDVCLVVTRYFGGILLGAPGLTRAYSHAATLAVEKAAVCEYSPAYPITLTLDYTLHGKLLPHLQSEDIAEMHTEYSDRVTLSFLVKAEKWKSLQKIITETCAGQAQPIAGDIRFADFS